ncbi:hypothetical protein MNBD_BACTEROID01-2248 [hydrothermal vent metagenome]|uniref:YtxH domain-containing protein n=1 Tax=hydrothermal vent metagenome TaxID=652676 RepID=A0A3B0UFY0_9ZZZZ
MDGKTKAIVAHITLIGWVIAFIINSSDKDEFASYYIRQTLGIFLLGIVLAWIPFIKVVAWIIVFIFWILSLVGSIQGEKKETPFVGQYFQDWFKAL